MIALQSLGMDWDHRGFPSVISPFIPYALDYNADLFDWLAPLADVIEFDVDPLIEDADWEMDCQDVHDVLALLVFTGNLDAPLP